MCWPTNFSNNWEDPKLNPWMKLVRQPDVGIAMGQFGKLYHLYQYLKVKIYALPPEPSLGDQTFTANLAWGVPVWSEESAVRRMFVMANMAPEHRRPEVKIAARWFADNRFNTYFLPEEIGFEGQGDIITTKNAYLYCYGIRNSLKAMEEIKKVFNLKKKVIPLKLKSSSFYHGDVCLRYSRKRDAILFHPNAFDEEGVRSIENLNARKIKEVNEKFVVQELGSKGRNFPLNGCYIDSVETFPWNDEVEEFPRSIRSWIESDGGEVVTLDFSQFGLSGAGHRCVTLFLD